MKYTREQIEKVAQWHDEHMYQFDTSDMLRQLLEENDTLRSSSAIMRDALMAIDDGFITSESNGVMARYMLAVKFKTLHGLQFTNSLLHLAIDAARKPV